MGYSIWTRDFRVVVIMENTGFNIYDLDSESCDDVKIWEINKKSFAIELNDSGDFYIISTDNDSGFSVSKAIEKTTIQTLIFDKSVFDTAEKAMSWARDHDFNADKFDETSDSYRIRQKDPLLFVGDSFRTIGITDGINAVIGILKKEDLKEKTDDPEVQEKAFWSTAYVNDLPDSAFLYIEPGGEKDNDGRTKPRSLRHWPVMDASGKLDVDHVRNAIARIPQSKIPGLSADDLKSYQDKARDLLAQLTKSADNIAKIVKKIDDGDEYYILGIVLEPNDGGDGTPVEPDTQKHIYSSVDIRKSQQSYMENFQHVEFMHDHIIDDKVKIIESYIAPVSFYISRNGESFHASEIDFKNIEDFEFVKKGSWLIGMRIIDNGLWSRIKSGDLDALSIHSFAHVTPVEKNIKNA